MVLWCTATTGHSYSVLAQKRAGTLFAALIAFRSTTKYLVNNELKNKFELVLNFFAPKPLIINSTLSFFLSSAASHAFVYTKAAQFASSLGQACPSCRRGRVDWST